MNWNLKICILVLFVAMSFGATGQGGYKKGFVVTLDQDTLSGWIRDGGGIRNRRICEFKAEKGDISTQYTQYIPGSIQSYHFDEGKAYFSHGVFSNDVYKTVFLEVLLDGSVSVYYDRRNKEMAYYLQKEDGDLIGLENRVVSTSRQVVLYNKPRKSIMVTNYLDTLQKVFKGCSPVVEKLNVVSYHKKDIVNITRDYINLTCKTPRCIRYEDLDARRNYFGFYSGLQLSELLFWSGQKSELTATIPVALFYNIPLSLFDERLSFQIELLYKYQNYQNSDVDFTHKLGMFFDLPQDGSVQEQVGLELKSSTIGVPMLLKFDIPLGKRFIPFIALGKETSFVVQSSVRVGDEANLKLHQTQKGGWLCDVGISYPINPRMNLFTSLRFQNTVRNVIVSSEGTENRYSFNEHVRRNPNYEIRNHRITLNVGMRF